MEKKNNLQIFLRGLIFVNYAIFAVVFEEWLFYITKPSMFYLLTFPQKLWSLFIVVGFFTIIIIICYCLLSAISLLFKIPKLLCSSLLAALVSISGIILMLDNITTTLWSWGIKDCKLYLGLIYLSILILIFIEIWRVFYKKMNLLAHRKSHYLFSLGFFVFCILTFLFANLTASANNFSLPQNSQVAKNRSMPNILLFSADGVNADNLKLYGYQHQTTPNLDAFAKNALLIENTSTNSLKTFSSLLSILTSKHPATTKTFYPPHVLTGSSSYSHLPGILRQYGYKNLQISTEYYADAFQANLLNGFDLVNGRQESGLFTGSGLLKNLVSERIFINELFNKLGVRALHLLRIQKMRDHYAEIIKNSKSDISDQRRIDELKEFVQNTNQPFFAQIHLLSTHCCRYSVPDRVFANDYDNAIYFTDKLFAEVIEVLKQQNKLDNTIVVYSSDHTDLWGVIKRVPLIFIFPDSNKFEVRKNNAQLLDIAPTLLDYLKIEKPEWMEGLSLLRSEPPKNRPIFSFKNYSHKT